jgi:hypothetical protein
VLYGCDDAMHCCGLQIHQLLFWYDSLVYHFFSVAIYVIVSLTLI